MNTAVQRPAQVDFGEAFGYVFRSHDWFGKIALGALCLLFFWLVVPVLILLGYSIETARVISLGERELPPWNNIGKKLAEGFVLAVVLFIWGLPGTILSWGGGGFTCTGGNCAYHPAALDGLGTLYSLLLGLLTPAIWSQYFEGGFGSAFDFRAIFRRAGAYPGMTVLVWLMAIVAGIIGGLGFLLILVGALFTLPYAFAVIANLYGQFGRLTRTSTAPAPA